MIRLILGLTLAGLLNTSVADAATLIYGSVFGGPDGPSTLWAFAPDGTPGNTTRRIGPIGFRRVGALDFSPSGTLYGVGSTGPDTVLITIDTATGAGTLVGSLGAGDLFVQDIAFRPADGRLFAFAEGQIFTIDTTTGTATIVGDAGIGFPFGNSLAFQGATLFYANEQALFTIDQVTGAATFVRDIVYHPAFGTFPRPPAMKFDPVTGTLWASINGVGLNTNRLLTLGTINPTTGQTTPVLELPSVTDGIAVTTGALPPAAAIPTLSEWAQIVLVAVLVLAGLVTLRRRRPALR
ncbi:MAG: IPTL-CTERM sorting domain-containing protein [Candidatus Rokuibacteriota bacterium]